MGIPFFIVFVLSIVFFTLAVTGLGDLIWFEWPEQNPSAETVDDVTVTSYLGIRHDDYWAIAQCIVGFLLFLVSLYLMGFLLYLEERESGRIMKNVKSFVKLRQFLERRRKRKISQ